ncbi:MAG: hypothetical protein A2W05_07300 [Candidatus Schekmanbacteria bacterium RBG_16_38_10]|uniref:DUF305 domain-containing protein n=1 Tax=Candidatus Schekmanbacteria bacterium RBG_16_38_10 TaxID=1817879 RepID=A0A1F7RV81_9BACT|nr:MAG: hypothetical protein A2W05_07300 [Candidatus Schekmanbacteria bacterium RBG_16_38_10]
MKDNTTLYLIIGVLAGVIVGILIASSSVRARNYPMMNMMGMGQMRFNDTDSTTMGEGGEFNMGHMGESMSRMMDDLQEYSGSEFDREFMERMIDHHQGAIDMAELAPQKSNRMEIKNLSNDIISAQKKEIEMMKSWMSEWFNN